MYNNVDGTAYANLNAALNDARVPEKVQSQAKAIENMGLMVEKLDLTINALLEILIEQGVEKKHIYDKIDEIIARRLEDPYAIDFRVCPKCQHKITESNKTPMRGTCFFCGHKEAFYPYDDEARKAAVEEQKLIENPPEEPYDVIKNLNLED